MAVTLTRILFTKDIRKYIAEQVVGRRNQELADMTNQKFGTDFTAQQIRNHKSSRKLKNHLGTGAISPRKLLTTEQDQFMRENYKGLYNAELTELINKEFGTDYTTEQVKNYKNRQRLDSGLTGAFEKGHVPFNKGLSQEDYMSPDAIERTAKTRFKSGEQPLNWQPIGYERITKDGYVEVKVSDAPRKKSGENYQLKHRYIWEKHYQEELTADDAIVFLDQNQKNFAIDNLVKVTRNELLRINQNKLLTDSVEINQVAVGVGKLMAKMGEVRRGVEDEKRH